MCIRDRDWDNESIQSGRCYEVTKTHGKKVIVMEPVKGGTLARIPKEAEAVLRRCTPDMTAASWAIRFAASLDEVLTVLSGMSDLQQMEENTGYMQQFEPLSEKEKGAVREEMCIRDSAEAVGQRMIDFEQTAYALYFIGTYFFGNLKEIHDKIQIPHTRKACLLYTSRCV